VPAIAAWRDLIFAGFYTLLFECERTSCGAAKSRWQCISSWTQRQKLEIVPSFWLSGTLTLPFCFGQHVLHNSHNFSLRSALFNRLFLAFMWYFGHRSLLIFSYFGYACPGDWFSPVSWKSIKHSGQNQKPKSERERERA